MTPLQMLETYNRPKSINGRKLYCTFTDMYNIRKEFGFKPSCLIFPFLVKPNDISIYDLDGDCILAQCVALENNW